MAVDVSNPAARNTERFSRDHGMKPQGIGRGTTVFPKHELLNLAHERGLTRIDVYPMTVGEDFAVFSATVWFDDGTSFTDVGDASPTNTNSTTKSAIPRMAATRAISRALALGMNVEHNIDVEMPQDGGGNTSPSPRQQAPAQGVKRANDDWEDE